MQKERKIEEDFYEDLAESLAFAMDNAVDDHGLVFDPYTGVLAVEAYDDDTGEVTGQRYFRLVPAKKDGTA